MTCASNVKKHTIIALFVFSFSCSVSATTIPKKVTIAMATRSSRALMIILTGISGLWYCKY